MKKKIKVIFTSSLVFNVFAILALLFVFLKLGGINYVLGKVSNNTPSYLNNTYYPERMSIFDKLEIKSNETVFIGDSLTQRGEWSELFNRSDIINRGINSDMTDGVINRLDKIVESNPKKAFIMIGINDLYAGREIQEIKQNYSIILKTFKNQSPNTKVFVQSVLPVNNEIYGDAINNEDVIKLNSELQKLVKEFNYEYVDVFTKVSKENQLNKDLTIADGIHLNGKGYMVWKETIDDYVQ